MTGPLTEQYRQLVGDHAVEFERRLHRIGATIEMRPMQTGWMVWVRIDDARVYTATAPLMATALWMAASWAGLTEGLNPIGART